MDILHRKTGAGDAIGKGRWSGGRPLRQYGFWRPYVPQVLYRYLDCGDIHNGFAHPQNVAYKW